MLSAVQRVLLVDEQCDDLALASLVLAQAIPDVRVESIDSAAALAGALAAGRPSLVIAERTLSWGDGFEVLEVVRQLHPDCPVVFFSARCEPSPEDTLRGLDGWLPKTSAGFLHLPVIAQRLARRAAPPSPAPGPVNGAGVAKLPVAVLTASPSGEILGANEAAAQLLGVSDRTRLEGRALQFVLSPGPGREALTAALQSGGTVQGLEVELASKDATGRWARLSLWSGPGPDGAVRFAATLEDISPYKHSEQRLTRIADELGRSNEALERFASVLSHDLRGPLGVVSRGARLLEDAYGEQLADEAGALVRTIVQGSERVEGMVQDILELARLESAGRPMVPTDLGEVAAQALVTLQPAIHESGASVSCDALPTLPADRGQMARLFENLLGNALKFRGEATPLVHIGAVREPGQWVFSVRDNGVGIDPGDAERVFGMFQRLHNGSTPGSGMGLAISKNIIERHGGRIWVQSMAGEGSTFYFTIPAGDAPDGENDVTIC